MRRLRREPRLHFLLLGAALFAASSLRREWTPGGPGAIVVTQGRIEHLAAGFTRVWQRPPTDQELDGLIQDHIREEVYCREATAMGLDRDDIIIRRRLRQKDTTMKRPWDTAGTTMTARMAPAATVGVAVRMMVTAAFALLPLLAGGCGATRPGEAVPEALIAQAQLPGMPIVRTLGDEPNEQFAQTMVNSARQEQAYYRAHPELTLPPSVDILAISGGGEAGAYGAGLLCGWTQAGTRPSFKLVTGISTGSLIAPFAFLGPRYDQVLRDSYTRVSQKDIFRKQGSLAVLLDDGMVDSQPLRRLVEKTVGEQVLTAVAAEHAKGRRLYIGTTDLDAQRPVLWDMGAIAASKHPRALELFRDIMIASASIPGAFPPVYIPVEVQGKPYHEMHVDGGTFVQVFLWGAGFSRARAQRELGPEYLDRPARLFVIRNSRIGPAWQQVGPRVIPIGIRAISTLIQANGLNDLFRLHQLAERNQMEYYLATIPQELGGPPEPFDTRYMNKLFDFAFEKAQAGYPWQRTPPIGLIEPELLPTTRPSQPAESRNTTFR